MRLSRPGPALAGVVLACSASTAPDGSRLAVSFDVRAAGSTAGAVAPRVAASSGGVVVAGRISTGDPCQDVTARATREGNVVTLVVTATRVGEGCIAVLAAFDYTAAVRGLASGRHTVRVVYRHEGPGGTVRTEQVAEREITTP